MTELLVKAFKKASKLPEIEQNVIAKWLIDELESEKKMGKIVCGIGRYIRVAGGRSSR